MMQFSAVSSLWLHFKFSSQIFPFLVHISDNSLFSTVCLGFVNTWILLTHILRLKLKVFKVSPFFPCNFLVKILLVIPNFIACYREHGFHISSSWDKLRCSSGPLYNLFMSMIYGNYKIIFLTLHVKSNHWMVTLAHLNFKNSIFTSFLNIWKIEIYVKSIIIIMICPFLTFFIFFL